MRSYDVKSLGEVVYQFGHGGEAEETGWRLVEDGHAAIVASDGHRASRPARLDEAHAAVRARVGPTADRLFDARRGQLDALEQLGRQIPAAQHPGAEDHLAAGLRGRRELLPVDATPEQRRTLARSP